MKRSIYTYILALLFLANLATGQIDVLMTNMMPYDSERYSDYNGTPYLWDEPMKVTIHSTNQKPVEGVLGNYNMVEGEFEVYDDKKFAILKINEYPKIEFKDADGNIIHLIAISHPKLKFGYCIQYYQDENFRFLVQWKKLKSTVTVNTPGEIKSIDKLKNSKDYYIFSNGNLIKFKPSKKKIIKKFGHKKEIKKFIKSNDLNLKKMQDVANLLKYISDQGWLK